MVSNNVYDAREANFTLFGLFGIDKDGHCECGNADCQAIYKHPRVQNWQLSPMYSDEQFSVMCEVGHLSTGYGILTNGIMVIDVDARNGGVESFKRLCEDLNIDFYKECAYVVLTGSGGGSMHLYFKSPTPPKALMQHHENYKGIDFKCNSGFVVGAGSKHKSGNIYEVDKGYPQDLTDTPIALLNLLEKKTQFRATDLNGAKVDIEVEELRNMVMHITGGDDYLKWRDVGLALHHSTSGSMQGLSIWEEWSIKFDKYKEGSTAYQWGRMGDNNPSLLSLGTLIHFAKQDGYIQPVTFDADVYVKTDEPKTLDDMIAHVDIRKPPKFAGVLCQWVNNQCLNPRENLAAAATLYILSCVGGMRHYDALNNMSLNFMPFCVAGSSSGKEPIFESITDCLMESGLMAAVHGSFKSEQEAVRNLLRHQASFYLIDEFGIELKKINQASKSGGASYLAGLIGFFMKVYSKANGVMPVSGDLKEDIKDKIKADIARLNKKMDLDGEDKHREEMATLMAQLNSADNGIVNPYLNIFGLTTPVTFDDLVTHEMATNGFIARSAIFREHETNPRRKKKFKKEPMPVGIKLALAQLYNGGHSDDSYRIERKGEKHAITTTEDAEQLLDDVYEYFHEMAEDHKTKTGLEAICRRGWEICSKISLLTGMPSGTRTIEDVMYGFAVAKWDIQKKIELAYGNEAAQHKDTRADALMVKIRGMLDKDSETTFGTLCNRLREFNKDQITQALDILVKNNAVLVIEHIHPINKKVSKKYKLA